MTTLSTTPATENSSGTQKGANTGCTGGTEEVKESKGEQGDIR